MSWYQKPNLTHNPLDLFIILIINGTVCMMTKIQIELPTTCGIPYHYSQISSQDLLAPLDKVIPCLNLCTKQPHSLFLDIYIYISLKIEYIYIANKQMRSTQLGNRDTTFVFQGLFIFHQLYPSLKHIFWTQHRFCPMQALENIPLKNRIK